MVTNAEHAQTLELVAEQIATHLEIANKHSQKVHKVDSHHGIHAMWAAAMFCSKLQLMADEVDKEIRGLRDVVGVDVADRLKPCGRCGGAAIVEQECDCKVSDYTGRQSTVTIYRARCSNKSCPERVVSYGADADDDNVTDSVLYIIKSWNKKQERTITA